MSDASPKMKTLKIQVMDRDAKNRIAAVFEELEQTLGIDGIGVVLTTSIMELVENAVKANLKRAFFVRHGYSLDDPQRYQEGIRAFVASYGRIMNEEYRQALLDLDLVVSVDVDLSAERLIVFVENNAQLVAEEERRIRAKLAKAMVADRFGDFYINYGDETEGSGLGLAMIVMLVRNLGFSPDHFRIYHQGGRTTARLEFPLNASYVPLRQQWARQNASGGNAPPV